MGCEPFPFLRRSYRTPLFDLNLRAAGRVPRAVRLAWEEYMCPGQPSSSRTGNVASATGTIFRGTGAQGRAA